jgi:hypothetical protein
MRQPAAKETAMAALDLEVLHGSRHEDTFQAEGDPGDAAWLRRQLQGWLSGHKWHQARWREFELIARPAGRGKQLAKVRA